MENYLVLFKLVLTEFLNPNLTPLWLDIVQRMHAEFESNLFLPHYETDILKSNVQKVLHYNHCLHKNYWATCLPYSLRKIEEGIL